MEKLNKKFWSILITLILFTSIIVFYVEKDYQPIKIDLFANEYISNLIINSGTICTEEHLNLEFNNAQIFAPQSFIINGECILPSTPLGYPLIITITKIIYPNLFKYINILFYTLLILFIYLIVKNNYSKKTAIIASFLCAIFAPILFFTTLTFSNILAILIYFTFLYYFLEGIKNKDKNYFLICGILAGFHMWVRFYDAIYYLPFLIFIKKDTIKNIIHIFITFIPFLILLLLISQHFYGSPIGILGITNENSIQTLKEPYIAILGYEPTFFVSFNLFLNNLIKYQVLFYPILFIFFIIQIATIKKLKSNKKLSYFLISLIFLVFAFFSLGAFQGFEYNTPILDSSYNRYFLPAFISMIILMSSILTEYLKQHNKKLVLLLLSLFIISNMLILFTSFSGISDLKLKQEAYQNKISSFSFLDNNSIVFSRYLDIYFYPNSKVAYYGKFPIETRIENTTELMQTILQTKKYKVYFANDDYWNQDPIESYLKIMQARGYQIIKTNNYLYEIKK